MPPEDLGTESTAVFPYSIDPPLLAQACARGVSGHLAPLDCRFGFGATIKMTIKTDQVADQIDVVDTVRLPTGPARPVKTNPVVGSLVAVIDGVDTPIDESGQVTKTRSGGFCLTPMLVAQYTPGATVATATFLAGLHVGY